ncbi:hypothetical protein F5Y09DRAFT_338739 [Xylaria sp. FL1042]|nr:hypothetical protein F5Y09DRAFT_338739 [Xylaria sp. FL1042]
MRPMPILPERNFPKFNLLPWELRDVVWVNYALPQRPMLHSVSYRCSRRDLLLCSFVSQGRDIDPARLPTTRALMQVSKEARKAVLAGRQLQRVKMVGYEINTFFGLLINANNGRGMHIRMHKFFFVNWDIDMFYFRRGLHIHVQNFLDKSCLLKMKRIAIDTKYPWFYVEKESQLNLPHYAFLFYGMSLSAVIRNLPALNAVHLVLDFHALRRLYAYTKLLKDKEVKEDTEADAPPQDEGNNNESEEGLGEFDGGREWELEQGTLERPERVFGSENEAKYNDWLAKLRTKHDEYGFHRVEPETYHYFGETFLCHVRRPIQHPIEILIPVEIIIPFQDWVHQMISETKKEIRKFCKHPVDINMVIDVYGGCPHLMLYGYYRIDREIWRVTLAPAVLASTTLEGGLRRLRP